MEISASEIEILARRINDSIQGYVVSSAYSIEGGILLRLRHESKQELLIAISSFASWITGKNLTLPKAEPFVSNARESIARSKLTGVKQAGKERIIEFTFQSKNGTNLSLLAEFFGGGNLILVNGEGIIEEAKREQTFRHRNLLSGEKYSLPPSRGVSLPELTVESLKEFLKSRDAVDGSLPSIKWFGRHVATSRKFVEEIFLRSGVKADIPAKSLSLEELESLAKSARQLQSELESSARGYLLLPRDSQNTIELDVCSLVPASWNRLSEGGSATIHVFETLSEALDEGQVQSLLINAKGDASKEVRSKAEELESAVKKQDALLERNSSNASELRILASEFMRTVGGLHEEHVKKLETLEVIEFDPTSGGKYRFVNEPRSFLSSFSSSTAVASRLFDEAKNLEVKNKSILSVKQELLERRRSLLEQTKTSEERATKRIETERRAREWFERYRWFFTSDLRLAVGGRDSTSNSIVINKYTEHSDFIFHADLHGSPFFVLKGNSELSREPSENIVLELAQATVSFSRAWKDELGSADAFWVLPDQVKKSAPSGEYLPRGSFYIEGKKNLVKHLRVELSVGLMTSDLLRKESSSRQRAESVYPVIVCGPEKSLSKYCAAEIKISPGKEKGTAIARKIKQALVGKVKNQNLRQAAKKLPIDEFVRVLPSGTFKVVSEKQNG